MRYNVTKQTLEAENEIEKKALEYLKANTPIFAAASEYMVRAYNAGYEAGLNAIKEATNRTYEHIPTDSQGS